MTTVFINDDTGRKNRVNHDKYLDTIIRDTCETWLDQNGGLHCTTAFITWLRKAERLYARYLRIVDYDTGAFDRWAIAKDILVSNDMADFSALYDLIHLAKQYRAEMRNGGQDEKNKGDCREICEKSTLL